FLALPLLYDHPSLELIYGRDLTIIVGLVVLLAHTRFRKIAVWLGTISWFSILVFELIRSIGVAAMGQDPLLYDGLFLSMHLFILMRDLLGNTALYMLTGLIVGLVTTLVFTFWSLRFMSTSAKRMARVHVLVIWGLMFGMEYAAESGVVKIKGKDSAADLLVNLEESYGVWSEIGRGVSGDAYKKLNKIKLKNKPRIHIYIVESYGRTLRRKQVRKEYYDTLREYRSRLSPLGWSMVTGLSEAPVSGGRSWLADATLLSGMLVKYESVYQHLTPNLSTLPTLPGFLKKQGYETVLVRPKDTARPGVELVNHFDFDRTVFSADLRYTGQKYGWAEIPDQYALGYVEEEVLSHIGDTPEFLFFHMASSHLPWDDLPPVAENWRDLSGSSIKVVDQAQQGLNEKEIKFQLKRYRRKENVHIRRLRPTAQNVGAYWAAIQYSLEVTFRHIESMEDPPDLIVVMGDHQPPMLKTSLDFTVPVHVLARDPKLLAEFRKKGFVKGLIPGSIKDHIFHEGFFSLLVRALTGADKQKKSKYLRRGATLDPDTPSARVQK
ncbi:MAG: sulfatase-like hydrolase/transferase, partial [Myxococcota bacterium]